MSGLISDPDDSFLEEYIAESHVPDDPDSPWWRILADLHPKQQAVLADPAQEKCLPKGRRAGGSWVVAAWLLEEWHRWPGHTSLFIALTSGHAKTILWPTLLRMNERYGLGAVAKASGDDFSFTLPNGYRILLRGAKDRAQVERLRGIEGGLRRAVIDEAGSFSRHDDEFRYLIDDVISPQFMDTHHLGGGQFILCGSPGLDPMGFYYECCTGMNHVGEKRPKWSTHHWTALHNPHLDARGYLLGKIGKHILDDTTPEQMMDEIERLKDVPLADPRWAAVLCRLSPTFRREYLADWVKDADALCYVPTERNLLAEGFELPRDRPWRITIGADVGWGDGNGFAVAAKSLRGREIVLLQAYYLPEMDDSEIAAELKKLSQAWRCGEIYVDCAGEGDRLVANMANYGVVVQPAGKGRKKPRIEYVRAVMKTGALQIRPEHCADVIGEWSALPWSEDRQTHREGFVDDVADAVLYAVCPLSQRFVPAKDPKPKPGQPGWDELQERREKAAAVRAGRRIVRRKRFVRNLVPLPTFERYVKAA